MAKQNTKSKKGFTIIEVVLVLAIAGLIFLMVFVALPALQRSQRDTQRRQDMSRVVTALTQYQANNATADNGALPVGPTYYSACKSGDFDANACTGYYAQNGGNSTNAQTGGPMGVIAKAFIQKYLNSATDAYKNTFQDPDGSYYSMFITQNLANNSTITQTAGAASLTTKPVQLELKDNGYTVTSPFNTHVVYILPGGKCNGEYVKKSAERDFAVMYRLEGAGVYCVDNQ